MISTNKFWPSNVFLKHPKMRCCNTPRSYTASVGRTPLKVLHKHPILYSEDGWGTNFW